MPPRERRGAADRGKHRQAAGAYAQERLVIQFPQSQKRRLRITPGLCFRSPGLFLLLHSGSARDVEIKMITAAEYRAWAEESLEWARNATKESPRAAYIKWAEIWLESALRVERLTALIEDRSKEPTPTAEYVWQLPPFHDWPRNRIEMGVRTRQRSSARPGRFDQFAFDFEKFDDSCWVCSSAVLAAGADRGEYRQKAGAIEPHQTWRV
jgi:hypothetical protein